MFSKLSSLLIVTVLTLTLFGCATKKSNTNVWNATQIAQSRYAKVNLYDSNNKKIGSVDTNWIRSIIVIKNRIERVAKIKTHLLITEGEDPNAFAWTNEKHNMVAFNLAMLDFLQKDADQFAFVFSHEIAHNVKRHSQKSSDRDGGLNALGYAVGFGLSMAGIPGAGMLSDAGVTLVKRKFDRDQEREADALGLQYMREAGFNPQGALKFNQRMFNKSKGSSLPFLSTHPTGQERIDSIKSAL
ncbi:MAG: M48 family metalloprotease [Magnetococcales bacterium]|nr:M48 family metalloprotease [Magnetococcales bacterium]